MKRSQKGFTLVELIIVIAVIGVLAAILIPVFANVIKKANAKSALADARNAVSLYVAEATDRYTRGEAVPEHIAIIVSKAGRYYVFGYDFNVSESIQVSNANENGINAATFSELVSDHSWNGLHAGVAYDPTADTSAYTIENDGAFYLVPYDNSGNSTNTNVRGFVTSGTENYWRISDDDAANRGWNLEVGDNTEIYHGCLVGANFTTTGTTGNGGTTGSDSTSTTTQYTVTLDLNGVDVDGYQTSYTVTEGDTFSCNNPSATGKTFNGWKNGTENVTLPITVTGDITLTAQWSTVTHTITIDPTWSGNNVTITGMPAGFNGGYTWDAPEGTNLNDIIGALHASDITGKDFLGWTINGINYDSSVTNALTADVTIAPVYGTTSLTVTFKVGTNETTINVDYGEHIDSADWPANPSDDPTDGHFRHWSYSGGEYTSIYPNAVTENMTFTAVFGWYTVTFYETDGTSSISTTHTGDTYDVPAPTLTSQWYYLSAWTASAGATACAADATTYTANKDNITLTAVEASKTITVSYGDGGTGASNLPSGTETFNLADTQTFTVTNTIPTLEHNDFVCWLKASTDGCSIDAGDVLYGMMGYNPGDTVDVYSVTTNTASVVIMPHFEPSPTYTVSYNANGGTGTMTDSTAYYSGDTATVKANTFTNTGNDFAGWNTAANGSGTSYAADDTFSVTANVTLYAQWTPAAPATKTIALTINDDWNEDTDTINIEVPASASSVTWGDIKNQDSVKARYWYYSNDSITIVTTGDTATIPSGSGFSRVATTTAAADNLNPTYTTYANSGARYQCLTTQTGCQKIIGSTNVTYNYLMLQNIAMSGAIKPIGWVQDGTDQYTGVFDGNGYSVTGFHMRWNDYDSAQQNGYNGGVGFFAEIGASGTVKNLTITTDSTGVVVGNDSNGSITSANYGILSGKNRGNVLKCSVSGSVNGVWQNTFWCHNGNFLGGIAGRNYGTIKYCAAKNLTIDGFQCLGGIAGANFSGATVTECYAYNVEISHDTENHNMHEYNESHCQWWGGLVGRNQGTVTSSYSEGFSLGEFPYCNCNNYSGGYDQYDGSEFHSVTVHNPIASETVVNDGGTMDDLITLDLNEVISAQDLSDCLGAGYDTNMWGVDAQGHIVLLRAVAR